ncbi:MAG: 2-hydroxyacyl-CoA dehydratase family protein, partial [Chloroflexota bacterium]
CPFLRSVMDLGLKDRYDFLDGSVFSHTCEVGEKMAHIWRMYIGGNYNHFIDTPHTTHDAAVRQHEQLLRDFQQTLEAYTGSKLTPEKLRDAVARHNRQRALVRELYDLRKPDPPRISGTETLQVMVALASLPVAEGSALLEEVIAEISGRPEQSGEGHARLFVWGSIMDNTALTGMIESLGASVVMDDNALGSRAYFSDVPATDDPIAGLARHYLVDVRNPRTFRETVLDASGRRKDYLADLESRFGYLADYAREWRANGIILEALRYCDSHAYEVPGIGDFLDRAGIPHIYLELDYSPSALGQLRTRVQAFLEVIGENR